MKRRTQATCLVLGLIAASQAVAAGQTLDEELRALDALREGLTTPLDVVDRQGASLLKKYMRPEEQAQIHYMLAHVHAQSGMREPKRIIEYAGAALDSKLIMPQQRGMLYSYLSSAHQADRTEKDFAVRRRKALAPLLAGLKELQAFDLPAVAPELPVVESFGGFPGDPAAEAQARQRAEVQWAQRRQVERTRELIQRRDVLNLQIKSLYARDPEADDELCALATEALGKVMAEKLVETAAAERERIEQRRKLRKKSSP